MATFSLQFGLDNAAFDDDPGIEIARILRAVGIAAANGREGGMIYDINGNRIGAWDIIRTPREKMEG